MCIRDRYWTTTVVLARSLPRTSTVRSVSSAMARVVSSPSGFAARLTFTRGMSAGVLRDTVAERPVLLLHLDQVDEHVLRPDVELAPQILGHAPVERFLPVSYTHLTLPTSDLV